MFQRSQLITGQAIIIAILVLVIVGVLIYDKINPNIGWFRDTLLQFTDKMSTSLDVILDIL